MSLDSPSVAFEVLGSNEKAGPVSVPHVLTALVALKSSNVVIPPHYRNCVVDVALKAVKQKPSLVDEEEDCQTLTAVLLKTHATNSVLSAHASALQKKHYNIAAAFARLLEQMGQEVPKSESEL